MGQDWVVGFPISHSLGRTKHEIIFISLTSTLGRGILFLSLASGDGSMKLEEE